MVAPSRSMKPKNDLAAAAEGDVGGVCGGGGGGGGWWRTALVVFVRGTLPHRYDAGNIGIFTCRGVCAFAPLGRPLFSTLRFFLVSFSCARARRRTSGTFRTPRKGQREASVALDSLDCVPQRWMCHRYACTSHP